MPSQLEEAALRYRGQLLRQERAAASEMVRAYAAAWQRTQARLAELQEQIDAARRDGLIPGSFTPRQPGGPVIEQAPGTFSLSWLYERDRLTTLLRQIEAELRQFGALAGELTEAGQLQAVQAAQENTGELVRRGAQVARQPELVGLFNRLSREAVQDLVGFASDGSPLRELFDALGPRVSRGVQDALVTAVATGIGPRETARLVRQQFGMGLNRALTIARTEQIRAYREASRRSYADNADLLDGWIWLSAHDSRSCASCWAMHGSRHPVTETLDDHPNGRCTMVPIVKGHDPNIPTGEELFKDLPLAQQRAILGPAAHEAWLDGRVSMAPDGRNSVVGQRDDPRWGTMRYARSLQEIVGQRDAKAYTRFVATLGANPLLRNLAGPDRMILKAALDVKRLSSSELQQVISHVAQAGFDETHLVRRKNITASENHFQRHQSEWPRGATLESYLASAGDAVRNAEQIFISRYQGQWQMTLLSSSGANQGIDGGAWILVEYRLGLGHWVTVNQPHDDLEGIVRNPFRQEVRWIRRTA
jgi:SPP1 gp7 family putative phage head morphogenesis protein